jgi:hypothetical protein
MNTLGGTIVRNLILIILLLALGAGSTWSAEPAAEQLLPLEKARDAYRPAAAFGKDAFFVVWQSGRLAPGKLREGPKYNGDIVGCRVDRTGKALETAPFVICGAPDLQELPRVAWGKDCFLAVWQDLRNNRDWDVYAARVSGDGKVLDPDGFLVSGGKHNQAKPRVAWDGKTFLVVWQDRRSGKNYATYTARVSDKGEVLDPDGVLIEEKSYDPVVASAGAGRSLVIFVHFGHYRGAVWHGFPLGAFITDGTIEKPLKVKFLRGRGPAKPAPSEIFGQCPVAMAAGKDSFLMSWKTFTPFGRAWSGARRFVHGGPFSGAVLDAEGSPKTGVKLRGFHKDIRLVDPDVAWDGSAYVAAWHETLGHKHRQYRTEYDTVYATRVSADGKTLGAAMNLAGKLRAPARQACVASDGAGTTLIGYEKCPETADVPVTIALRILTAPAGETASATAGR